MTETVTCTYNSADQLENAREDLVATGIPQEKIYLNEQSNQVKVVIPAATKPEVVEILKRHKPSQLV